ncbi:carbohydrate kinase family protein [Edaphobacter flagellatus]|uniref:carbohydrate kinase family protein n=1 Tax=Edaphobacter flagellatus TaxID=1933044 RepID=UPI0021B16FE1|nr:carbohydrate kinase family protein [Edaphobacter flagellatus]
MSYDVTVIGEIYLDHVFGGFAEWPSPGEEIFTEQYAWELGGGAVTTACALSRLGRKVRLIGVVGDEQFAAIEARLSAFGVSAANISRCRGRTGVTVSISTVHDRSFFTYRGVNQELLEYLRCSPDVLHEAARAKHIHLALPLGIDDSRPLLPALRSHGATISVDVGHHIAWLKDTRSLEVLRAIDYVMPNEKEATILAGTPARYLELCQSLGVRHALVKLGSAGAALLADGVQYRVRPPHIESIDTTGAGDAFDAGFIEGVLSGLSPQQCVEFACVCGALSTRAVGALEALPTRAQAEAICEENYAA